MSEKAEETQTPSPAPQSMPPLTRERLDKTECKDCGDKKAGHSHALILNQTCHPNSGVIAIYEAGVLHLRCAARMGDKRKGDRCGKPVFDVLIAKSSTES